MSHYKQCHKQLCTIDNHIFCFHYRAVCGVTFGYIMQFRDENLMIFKEEFTQRPRSLEISLAGVTKLTWIIKITPGLWTHCQVTHDELSDEFTYFAWCLNDFSSQLQQPTRRLHILLQLQSSSLYRNLLWSLKYHRWARNNLDLLFLR